MTTNQPIQNKSRQTFVGVIVSDKMKDTAVVSIKRYEKHPKYKKFISRNAPNY
jgi:ribosomal protein S17